MKCWTVAGVVAAVLTGAYAVRLNAATLTGDQWRAYQDAVRIASQGGANSAFNKIANDHGVPNFYCPHGNLAFAVWHRRFIQRMEKVLGASIPYWDWTKDPMPSAFTDETYTDRSGRVWPNPLLSGVQNDGQATERDSTDVPISDLLQTINFANQQTDFAKFSQNLEFAHNTVHGSIGGSMGLVSMSAFDPIFWSHHCNVERFFYLWQLRHPNASYNSRATGRMQDSDGTFLGSQYINDFSGWKGSRASSGASPEGIGDMTLFQRPQLFAFIHNLPTTLHPTLITVNAGNTTLGSSFNFGMKGSEAHVTFDAPLVLTKPFVQWARKNNATLADLHSNVEVRAFDKVLKTEVDLGHLEIDFQWHLV
ncbi:Tyrosinase copper-binding domain-containing protein [Plasmodiophora brassicae]